MGIVPWSSEAGSGGIDAGASRTSRRSSFTCVRQNGVKTVYGFPCPVRGLETSATKLPGCGRGATPASFSAAMTALSRASA